MSTGIVALDELRKQRRALYRMNLKPTHVWLSKDAYGELGFHRLIVTKDTDDGLIVDVTEGGLVVDDDKPRVPNCDVIVMHKTKEKTLWLITNTRRSQATAT